MLRDVTARLARLGQQARPRPTDRVGSGGDQHGPILTRRYDVSGEPACYSAAVTASRRIARPSRASSPVNVSGGPSRITLP